MEKRERKNVSEKCGGGGPKDKKRQFINTLPSKTHVVLTSQF